MDDYMEALFDIDREVRVVGVLSVQLSVWVGWMNAEMSADNARRTFGLKRVADQVWSKRKPLFEVFGENYQVYKIPKKHFKNIN